MENLDTNGEENKEDKLETGGVRSVRNERGHYILEIIWKDGKKGEYSFPESGFEVVNPLNGKRLSFVRPDKVIEILKNNTINYNQGEFSWLDFVG